MYPSISYHFPGGDDKMYKLHRIKDIDIIGVQIDFGASQKGVAMGPLAIRYAGTE